MLRIRPLFCIAIAFGALLVAEGKFAQERHAESTPLLVFEAKPQKARFIVREKVNLLLRLSNAGKGDILVNRVLVLGYTVWLRVVGPEGKEIAWCGKVFGGVSSLTEFALLRPGASITRSVRVSCDKARFRGYDLNSPGKYVVFAEYHDPTPRAVLKQIAGKATVLEGPVRATPLEFWLAAQKPN